MAALATRFLGAVSSRRELRPARLNTSPVSALLQEIIQNGGTGGVDHRITADLGVISLLKSRLLRC